MLRDMTNMNYILHFTCRFDPINDDYEQLYIVVNKFMSSSFLGYVVVVL